MTTRRTTTVVDLLPRGDAIVGRQRMAVTCFRAHSEGYDWDVYRTAKDEWWEGCGSCQSDSGVKPWFGHVYGGVCFQCGGAGIHRLAASEKALATLIRRRVSGRKSRQNAHEKRLEAEAKRLAEWNEEHPNVAGMLAAERAFSDCRSTFGSLALQAGQRPLSVAQLALAERLLFERAWDETHTEPERAWLGDVGERVTCTSVVNVRHLNVSHFYDRGDTMMIVLENGAKTTTAARWAWDVNVGDTITIRGTVSDLKENERYGRQTILKRPQRLDK